MKMGKENTRSVSEVDPKEPRSKFYALTLIVVVQSVALLYLLYDHLLVTIEPQHALVEILSGIAIATNIGLALRMNAARLALSSVAILSIFGAALQLLAASLILFVAWITHRVSLFLSILISGLALVLFTQYGFIAYRSSGRLRR